MSPAALERPPRVKICGVRRLEDALLAAELGAEFVGCVLAEDSPRRASTDEVRSIAAAVEGRAQPVLVFRKTSPGSVLRAVRATGVRRVQLPASAAVVRVLQARGLVVHRVHSIDGSEGGLPRPAPAPTAGAPALLDVGRGGSGVSFPWEWLGDRGPEATFVAGGIRPSNLARLLRHRPHGIDLSSGVEVRPGVKDHGLLVELFEALRES